jgi:hypothetical protein
MARRPIPPLLDFLISAVCWVPIVFMLGWPLFVVVAFVVTHFPAVSSQSQSADPPPGLSQLLRDDGSPVFREVADGTIAAGDSVDVLIAAHPPDLTLVSPKGLVLWYRGAGKDVRSLLVMADGDRLVAGIAFSETAPRRQEFHFGGLPLVVCRDQAELCPERPSLLQLDYRQGLLGLTGGLGVAFDRE